jgi:hypothetical protein
VWRLLTSYVIMGDGDGNIRVKLCEATNQSYLHIGGKCASPKRGPRTGTPVQNNNGCKRPHKMPRFCVHFGTKATGMLTNENSFLGLHGIEFKFHRKIPGQPIRLQYYILGQSDLSFVNR